MLPVIIVGAGPTGLALALALARHGIPSVVLDGGDGRLPQRLARSCVLPADTSQWATVSGARGLGAQWSTWRTTYRLRTVGLTEFPGDTAPLHLPQHTLERALRDATTGVELIRVISGCRLSSLEQDDGGITAHTFGHATTRWRGSHLVGCDGARSTVRKLLDIPFPGRTNVERYAVAVLDVELPWPGEAGLHRGLPGMARSEAGEVTVRPLGPHRWRLDWPLPADGGLVTPDTMLDRIHATLAAWHDEEIPSYELRDTGVLICHQRLARRWRTGRVFLAGDAAHLLGALGTQQVAEGLRDADNLAWKLAVACHEQHADPLLDSYEAERRTAVAGRLRAVDQALPLVRGRNTLAARLIGQGRGRLGLLTDGHLGRGPLGTPGTYDRSPLHLTPAGSAAVSTAVGAPVANVPVIGLDGARDELRHRLGGPTLLLLTAPGSGVWEAKHWLSAGLMPELAIIARELPLPAELLVTEEYPGAAAHTVLVIRPDGRLAVALPGAAPDDLRDCVRALRGITS